MGEEVELVERGSKEGLLEAREKGSAVVVEGTGRADTGKLEGGGFDEETCCLWEELGRAGFVGPL